MSRLLRLSKAVSLSLVIAGSQALAEPLKGGIQQSEMRGEASGYDYPAYPQTPMPAQPVQQPPIRGTVQQTAPQPPRRPPIQAAVQQRVVLPPNFLGAWSVQGERTKVEALPEFQAGAEQAFQMRTSNVWNIGGNPSAGYSMSNDAGVNTALVVDKVEGNTAFIRYQHPVGNTMAQEAIVMSLVPGGAQFNGLERVSIVKQGMPQPRAKVTYRLVGRRR